MTQLIERINGLKTLPWITGALAGITICLFFMVVFPSKPRVILVPQIVEKQVIIKVPTKLTNNDKRQIQCLAENAYFEARGQSVKGMVAVSNVVMNRTKDSDTFAETPCGVINQKRHGVCQFSWVCTRHRINDTEIFAQTYRVAQNVYLENVSDLTYGATFYHANYVHPSWKSFTRTTQIGQHIFYRV